MRLARNLAAFIMLACVFAAEMSAVGGQATFLRTPANYNPQTGAFTLGETAYGGLYGKLCLAYDYFVFSADGGQAVSWHLNSPGQVVYNVIIDASQLRFFNADAQNCYLNIPGPLQFFNSQTTLTWTPAVSGQYGLIFFTRTFYSGPIYVTS